MRIDRIQANRILAIGGFTLRFLFLLAVIVLAAAAAQMLSPASEVELLEAAPAHIPGCGFIQAQK